MSDVIDLLLSLESQVGTLQDWARAAYIDPNSGGMLFQLLAAFFAIFSGLMLFFSRQIKTAVARIRRSISETFKR